MPYLINPGGRMVAIDDERQYQEYLKMPGFKVPTEEQTRDFVDSRLLLMQQMDEERNRILTGDEILFTSVSPGGKNGYGVASTKLVKELKNLNCKITPKVSNQKVGILFHAPYSILAMPTPIKILYTMFESDKIPEDWKDYLDVADLILVPSKWCQDVFKKAGFDAKVLPLGYDDRVYQFQPRYNKREARESFTFLHYNAFNIRKGFPEVLNAFVAEFQKDEPVKMIFKTDLNMPPWPILKSEYPNIEVLKGPYEEYEMLALMKRSDCFVFPSRGEGFGLPPLEAMATGMPVIVPNAHGITEYFNPDYMYEVAVEKTCPAIYTRYKGVDTGNMVVCSVEDLRKKMRWVYEHQKEALEKGAAASNYVKRWTFARSAEQLKTIIDKYQAMDIKDRPVKNVLILEEVA